MDDSLDTTSNSSQPASLAIVILKSIFILILLSMSLILIFSKDPVWVSTDYVNFIIHEVGHPTLVLIGSLIPFLDSSSKQFITVAGGTIFQLLIPSLILLYFFKKKTWYSVLFCVWWIGNNLVNIKYYIADASCQCLPLLSISGSDGDVIHDWHYMLSQYNLLNSDQLIANIVFIIGIGLMIISIVLMAAETFLNSKFNTKTNI